MMGKKNPFTVPEGYFDQLANQVIGQLPKEEERKPAMLRRLRPLLYAAACTGLAIFGISIYLNDNASEQMPTETALQETFYNDSFIDDAADYAMLDNDDIYSNLLADI